MRYRTEIVLAHMRACIWTQVWTTQNIIALGSNLFLSPPVMLLPGIIPDTNFRYLYTLFAVFIYYRLVRRNGGVH